MANGIFQSLDQKGRYLKVTPARTEVQDMVLMTIGQTVRQFEQEMVKSEETKEKCGGILSFLKRR